MIEIISSYRHTGHEWKNIEVFSGSTFIKQKMFGFGQLSWNWRKKLKWVLRKLWVKDSLGRTTFLGQIVQRKVASGHYFHAA